MTFWEPAIPSFVTSRISEDLLCPTIQTVNEGTEWCGTQDWGILVVTSLQLDSVPPVATLWMWLFSQVSVHLAVHSPVIHQLLHEDLMGKVSLWENFLAPKQTVFIALPLSTEHCSLPKYYSTCQGFETKVETGCM